MSKKKKLQELTSVLLIIAILSLALRWLLPALTSEEFKNWVRSLGPFGPLVIIFYTALSHVFAPLAGTPGIVLGLAVFGLVKTSIFVYLGSLISAAINFYISRRFGRKWVVRLVGKKTMEEFVFLFNSKFNYSFYF